MKRLCRYLDNVEAININSNPLGFQDKVVKDFEVFATNSNF